MYRVSEHVRSARTQDGVTVLDIHRGQMFNLNLVGSRILELLMTGASESAIVNDIACQFDVSGDAAAVDVREFIERLKHHQLIEDLA